jgi:hypothetical protein
METDREDLLREATALRVRAEFRIPSRTETVVAGRRDNGGWSTYFGQDPCYHFDADGRLRRAYVRGRLYRTQETTLAELQRVRSDTATQLLRRDLEPTELNDFLNDMRDQLTNLRNALQTEIATLQTVPANADVAIPLTSFLSRVLDVRPALAPPIKTRRH